MSSGTFDVNEYDLTVGSALSVTSTLIWAASGEGNSRPNGSPAHADATKGDGERTE